MFALAVAAFLAADPSTAVARPALPGFVKGYEAAAGGASILEEVPTGESVQKWTRMITTQRFEGLATRVDAARFLSMLAQGAASSCPGATASEVREINGASQVRLDCPLNSQTGLPETFIARAVANSGDLNVFQVAWRRAPTEADIAWGENYLNGISLKQ